MSLDVVWILEDRMDGLLVTMLLHSDKNMPLHLAAENGHQDVVKILVNEFGCGVDDRGQNGQTACHGASRSGHDGVVHVLLSQLNADPKATDSNGNMPIHTAAANGHQDTVRMLVNEFGCGVDTRGQNGWTACHYASAKGHYDTVRVLVSELHADPKATNDLGDTPIHVAAMCGCQDVIKMLVNEFGCGVDTRGQNGWTACHYTSAKGHYDTVRVLISELHADSKATSDRGELPLHVAAANGHQNIVRILVNEFGCSIDSEEQNGCTACHYASAKGHYDTVRVLVSELHSDPRANNDLGDTPIHVAAICGHQDIVKMLVEKFGCYVDGRGWNGWTACHQASQNGHDGVVRVLLSQLNADPKATDNNGNMPIHLVAAKGQQDIVRMLVNEFECGVDDRGQNGWTACHYASQKGHCDTVRVLVSELHADPRATTDQGCMPLHISAANGHQGIVQMLVNEFGCGTDDRGQNGWTASHCASEMGRSGIVRVLLSQLHADAKATDDVGDMPLHTAAVNGHQDIVKMLVNEFGCSVNDKGQNGVTACHLASAKGHYNLVRVLVSQLHADPKAIASDSSQPLHVAAAEGHQDIVRMLVDEFGCGVDDKGQNGWTACHYAFKRGHIDTLRVLLSELHGNSRATTDQGDMSLHVAAESGHRSIVKMLVNEFGCGVDDRGQRGLTACHCASGRGHSRTLKVLISELHANPKATTDQGNMPLHLAAAGGHQKIILMLVNKFGCGIDDKGRKGWTACHWACAAGNVSLLAFLVSELHPDLKAVNADGYMPLHLAAKYGCVSVLQYLVTEAEVDPQSKDLHGATVLHHACSVGNLDILKLLIFDLSCDPMVCDGDGNTILHVAAMNGHINIVRELTSILHQTNCCNFSNQTPLHLATGRGHEELVRVLVEELQCDPNIVDANGDTVVHYAARTGNHLLVAYLLSYCKLSSSRNNQGQTPLFYAIQNHHVFVVSELVKHNCKPSTVEGAQLYKELEKSSTKRLSQCSLTKVFVIGNKAVGKSTLVDALKADAHQESNFVQYVTPNTCGIVPSVHESDLYGRVLFYDFAGDAEYYSSHAASLERLLTSACHIFVLVIDLSEEDETITQKLGYWLTFTSYNSRNTKVKSQVIIVGSHADVVARAGENAEDKMGYLFMEVSEEFSREMEYIEMSGYCALDCRDATCDGIQSLSSLVKVCSLESNGQADSVSAGASVLLGVLDRDFKDRIACQVSEVRIHVEIKEIYLPLELPDFYSYLEELNARGLVLILGNREGLNEEWVVLDISAFLSNIHKKLLSKSSLKYMCARKGLSNLGIISESDLRNLGPDYDPRLLKQCLKHLQYCIEIDDNEVLYKILNVTHDSIEDPNNPRPKLLFFPALLPEPPEGSKLTWASDEGAAVCKGWYIECLKPHEYFPPRFLHVLLLRLAFSFALPLSAMHATGRLSEQYSRRCQLWKSGIKWVMSDGRIECVVQLVRVSKGVVVMVRGCDGSSVECSSVLINIVGKVLAARQDFCHSLVARMYLLDPNSMKQKVVPDIDQVALFDPSEVEKQLPLNGRVVSVDEKKIVSAIEFQRHCIWDIIFPISTKEVLEFVTPSLSWYELGLQLDVPERILDAIEQDNPRNVTTCTRRLVQEWLTTRPRPSWYLLVIALRKLRENRTTADISERYSEVVAIQEALLDDSISSSPVSEDFIDRFSKLVAPCWPLLASLLSLSTAEIDQIKRGVTGTPFVKAAAMMNRWREMVSPTYLTLRDKLSALLEEQLMALQ